MKDRHAVVEQYLTEELPLFLSKYDIPKNAIDIVAQDIGKRIYSLLYHWNDIELRNAFLTIGMEEANFYSPTKDLTLKSFVVIAMRNSQFENLVSTEEAAHSIGMEETNVKLERKIELFTRHAINYFKNVDFNSISHEIEILPKDDFFGELSEKYQHAIKALSMLGGLKEKEVSFEKINNKEYELVELGLYKKFCKTTMNITTIVESGITEEMSTALLNFMGNASLFGGLYFPSFKEVTRNTEKLLKVIEYLLSRDLVFVTHNYYLTNGYISRRKNLLKPGHTNLDTMKCFRNRNGLQDKHNEMLNRFCESV